MKKVYDDQFRMLPSEIKKVERLANKLSGRTDAKVTAYSSRPDPLNEDFVICTCEICYNYEDVADFSVKLFAFMPDRRRSWAH